MCPTSVDGIVQTGIFFLRNGGKVATGKDTGRVGAAAAQLGSLTDKLSESTSIFGDTISGAAKSVTGTLDKGILAVADKLGKTEAVQGLAQKAGTNSIFGAVAQKAVNPLLIGAAGIRILNDDDQYAALIEETSAMGLMLGTEKLMKNTKGNFFKLTGCADDVLKDTIEHSKGIEKLTAQAAEKFKGLTKGQQTAAKVGIGLLFVAGSICAYSIGDFIGKKLSGRDKKQ